MKKMMCKICLQNKLDKEGYRVFPLIKIRPYVEVGGTYYDFDTAIK